MSLSIESSSRPSEYVNVTQILDRFVATYTNGKKKTLVMNQLVKDENVAQAAAAAFGKERNIIYISETDEDKRRLFTVLIYEEKWYPVELQKDKTVLLTSQKIDGIRQSLGGTKIEAIHAANLIAFYKKGLCFPGIGIAISEKMSEMS